MSKIDLSRCGVDPDTDEGLFLEQFGEISEEPIDLNRVKGVASTLLSDLPSTRRVYVLAALISWRAANGTVKSEEWISVLGEEAYVAINLVLSKTGSTVRSSLREGGMQM